MIMSNFRHTQYITHMYFHHKTVKLRRLIDLLLQKLEHFFYNHNCVRFTISFFFY
jgi:hypothetical protein